MDPPATMSGFGHPPERFELTESDKASALWMRLKTYFEDRIDGARKRNDDTTLSEAGTAALRGEIRTLIALMRLGDDRPIISTGDDQPP